MRASNIWISVLVFFALLISCNTDSNKKFDVSNSDCTQVNNEDHVKKVKVIFYNIPTPLEITSLLERAGANFNMDLLNSLKNEDKYTTNMAIAVNLGIYGADLSYCRIFEQIQETLNYLAVIKKFSAKLGIPQDEKFFAVDRLEANIDNRDSLLSIITQTYANADAYLKQNDRAVLSAVIIMGGWVETMYIATSIVDQQKPNKDILRRIAEQKYSLTNLISLMKLYSIDETVAKYIQRMEVLKLEFDKIPITKTNSETTTDEKNKVTKIYSKNEIEIDNKNILQIRRVVTDFRSELIK